MTWQNRDEQKKVKIEILTAWRGDGGRRSVANSKRTSLLLLLFGNETPGDRMKKTSFFAFAASKWERGRQNCGEKECDDNDDDADNERSEKLK